MLKTYVANLLFAEGGTRITRYFVRATDELEAKAYFRKHFEKNTMVIEAVSEMAQDSSEKARAGEVRPVSNRPRNLQASR
jgi:hypothetical protein